MASFFSSLFDSNEKQIKKYHPVVDQISAMEESVQALSDDELAQTATYFRQKLGVDPETVRKERDPFLANLSKEDKKKQREKDAENLYKILPEVYARVREASRRKTGHRHFDVQALGGVFLAHGFVIEHFTGEGKTLVATMPLYLYALMGKGVHLVTVNDYLARRDGEWAGFIYKALGLSVGIITPSASYRFVDDEEAIKLKGDKVKELIAERKKKSADRKDGLVKYDHMNGSNLIQCNKNEAYACDIVYGTNNEFGFDYLRDNMARSNEERVQGPLYYAIVDECDSILIDEARTPLIISSPAEESNELYKKFADLVNRLDATTDYVIDEKAHSVALTDEGVEKIEKLLGVDNIWENYAFAHHIDNALKAKELYKLDDEYIVRDGEVLIVDEFTGRVLPGRRYSEGLHQAIEAKEGVEVKRESRTLATITFQNYFRLYDFLAGMTGTALTEAEEFAQIYKLEVIVVPTNLPVVRKDSADVVYRTKDGKYRAVVRDIKDLHEKGRPVLVGTTSVEISEHLSKLLNQEGIPHNVLNAKQHEKEAKIVAQAGQKGSVTIATNMAGRGTDIALGEGVKDIGGLHIIGTERHESRRIDNQLRGRSGRQGDPGSSRFYVSFEDDLMRIFGGDMMSSVLTRVGMDDDMPIESGLVGRSIESAQKKVESYHFDIRKHLVEYDDVLSQQREIIYDLRRKILTILAQYEKEVGGSKMPQGKVKMLFDLKKVNGDLAESITDRLMKFSLKDPGTWNIEEWKDLTVLSRPLRLWVLKLSLQHVGYILGSQLKDDAEVDSLETRKVLAGVLDVVPQELADVVVKELGYKDWEAFAVAFYKLEKPEEKERELDRLIVASYIAHLSYLGDGIITDLERVLILQTIDQLWMEHLDLMTDLREGIGLRGYANRDPLVEYKNEGFNLFDKMLTQIEDSIVRRFFKVRVVSKAQEKELEKARAVHEVPGSKNAVGQDSRPGKVTKSGPVVKVQKVGRNDPCPCGSGKKYKKCCYPKYG